MSENQKPNLKCNIMFQKENEFNVQDTRFTKVKIWLMHTGLNHNSSSFSKEAIEDAIPSLANTPILGFIEKNSEENKDFADHRSELYFDENGVLRENYLCQAYGVIPEQNNAHFEKRLCDDGIEREFLVVDGLVWNKLSEGVDILNRDICKAQSMELSNEYEGEFDENYVFHFKKFQFYGACILGDDYLPAMENASIELTYSKLQDNVKEKMTMFTKSINGGNKMGKNINTGTGTPDTNNEPVVNYNENSNTGENTSKPNEEPNKNDDNNDENKSSENNKVNKSSENSSEYIILKHQLEMKEKDKEIEKLKCELQKSEEEKNKIQEEFSNYKNVVEIKEKFAMLEEYEEILENVREFQSLKDENILNSFTVDGLKKELDSMIGQRVKLQNEYAKKDNGVTHYFNRDNEINFNTGHYGGFIDELMNR